VAAAAAQSYSNIAFSFVLRIVNANFY
jgi:hypothetical protein